MVDSIVGALNYNTCIYGDRSNAPCIGQVLVPTGQMTHLFPSIALEGVVGHNTDRCITSCKYGVAAYRICFMSQGYTVTEMFIMHLMA